MQDAWFLLLLVAGFLIFGGTLLFFWLQRLVAEHRDKEALTAADLELLHESVETLIARLQAATTEAVAEIDARQRALQALLDRVDDHLPTGETEAVETGDVARLVRDGVPETDVARLTGLTRGEVELMLEVHAARR